MTAINHTRNGVDLLKLPAFPEDQLSPTSKPEAVTTWLLTNIGGFKNLLGLLVVASLTIISICFNIELGRLLAVDKVSGTLLPIGYASLDLAALFLSGYVAVKSRKPILKAMAWLWFLLLVSLSLFAAASYSVSVDARLSQSGTLALTASHKEAIAQLEEQGRYWTAKLQSAPSYRSATQAKLNAIQAQKDEHLASLSKAEANVRPAPLAIFYRMPLPKGMNPEEAAAIMRLVWSFAMIVTPLLLVLLIVGSNEKKEIKVKNVPRKTTVPVPDNVLAFKRTVPEKESVPFPSNGTDTQDRYSEIKAKVQSGEIKPSVRAVQKATGYSTDRAGELLRKMLKEGILQRQKQGYSLVGESDE